MENNQNSEEEKIIDGSMENYESYNEIEPVIKDEPLDTSPKELYGFVFRCGNDFNVHKLNDDGSIWWEPREGTEYIDLNEITIETKRHSLNSYDMMSSLFSEGDVLKISSFIDENGAYIKKTEKVMDKNFCLKTQESWNEIKHHWFYPQGASNRLEEHIQSL